MRGSGRVAPGRWPGRGASSPATMLAAVVADGQARRWWCSSILTISTCIVENVGQATADAGCRAVAAGKLDTGNRSSNRGGEVAQQKCADDVDDEGRPRPSGPGRVRQSVSKAALARVPSAPAGEDRGPGSRPSKLNMSQSIAVQLSDRRTTRFSEEQNRGDGCESTCRSAGPTRRSHRCGPRW